MTDHSSIPDLSAIKGVDQFIVTDHHGRIIEQRIRHHERMAQLLSACGSCFCAIGKSNFKYAVFERSDQAHFFIFQVGKYYLGVVKQIDVEDDTLIKNIKNVLTDDKTKTVG